MDTLYIVMPAYNEQENIEDVVAAWHPVVEKVGGESRLVIFNDGSKDDTFNVMKSLEGKYPRFTAATKENTGHGATCIYAYRYAIEHGAEYIFQTDSDGQTDPNEFWGLWKERENFDFLIGSRTGRQDGFSRVIVTKILRLIIYFVFRVYVKDANTPFRLMKRELLSEYLKYIPQDFFLSNVAISTIAVKFKQRILWIPITFKSRQKGTNSINIKKIIKIGINAIGGFININKKFKKKSYEI